MNNAIIVEYDPFSKDSRVCLFTNEKRQDAMVSATLEELTENLVSMAYQNNIYDVHVHAPYYVIGEIERMVGEEELNVYSANKIQVRGI